MSWEQQTIEKVLLETVKEQRRARRWRIFFRLVFIAIIGSAIFFANMKDEVGDTDKGPQVAVINFVGVISDDTQNYKQVIDGLHKALKDKATVGVIIRANSPGGSPVYSDILNNEITRMRQLYPNKPIVFVIDEVCASGCYYAAAAAESVYANPSSIVVQSV